VPSVFGGGNGAACRWKEDLRAARANRHFGTDEKRIRTKMTVMVNPNQVVWVSTKIVNSMRMCFSSACY